MPVLAQPEGEDRLLRCVQNFCHLGAPVQVGAMRAPSGDDLISPFRACKDCRIVFRADWVACFAHLKRVSIAPRKDIGHLKRPKSQRPGAPFAALNRGVVLDLGGFGRVQHHKQHALALGVPRAGQRVSVAFAIGVDGG